MDPTRIHALIAVWQRPEITKICFEGIWRLGKYDPARFAISATAVCSEDGRWRPLCDAYGFNYVHTTNRPLGAKWNAGLAAAMDCDFDYLMVLGSDNIVSDSLLDVYAEYIQEKYFLFGASDLYVYSVRQGLLKYFAGYNRVRMSIGAGRMIHREVIEALRGKLWKRSRRRGLDGSALRRARSAGYDEEIIDTAGKAFILDIKSEVNLNRFEHLRGPVVDTGEVFANFGKKEIEMLQKLKR